MSQNTSSSYFDLHTTGVGYLNRFREVTVRRGQPFHAVEINALHGASDQVEYTRFDCRLTGSEAVLAVRKIADRINLRGPNGKSAHRVLCSFKIGDVYPDLYKKADGSPAVVLKGRLLRVDWIKVDGEVVYTAPKPHQAVETPTSDEVLDGELLPLEADERHAA